MDFEFATAGRIVFGAGASRQLPGYAVAYGKRVLLCHGSTAHRAEAMLEGLEGAGMEVTSYAISGEPDVAMVKAATERARAQACELVVAVGGGSVIDAGKAISALLTNPGDVFRYLEVIGEGQPLTVDPAPCIALPTTAGTGSEVTRNAVLGSAQHRVKVSIRHEKLLPRVALVDPLLTHSLPPQITAASGMDALSQLAEVFVSPTSSPLTDGICREGLTRVARSLKRAFLHGDDAAAREDMAVAGLFGGLALANAKLGAVHGFAGPLGGMFRAPHGYLCARLLPFVMEANIEALEGREPESPALERFRELACILTGRAEAGPRDGAAWAVALADRLEVAPLRIWGVREASFPQAIEKARKASSMRGNPITLEDAELTGILERAL